MAGRSAVSLSFITKLLHRQHTTSASVASGWWLNVEPHGHLAGPTERLDWGRIKRGRATERDTERVVALRRLFVQSLGKGRIGLQQV